MDLDQLKQQLLELVESSPALNSVSPEEKEERIASMMEGSSEDIEGYIQVLVEEKKEIEKVDEELDEQADTIHEKVVTAKYDKIKTDRIQELEKEKLSKNEEKDKVDDLLNSLGKANVETPKEDKKTGVLNEKSTQTKLLRGTLAALIGMLLCGLAGILIIYGVVLSMGEYAKLDVVLSVKPIIIVNAYWAALGFGALIGLILIPVLRLTKKKSVILSGLFGLIIGGIILAVSHMAASGLDTDIVILINSKPIGIRGYWIAAIFAIILGFLGRFVLRLINSSKFFNLTSDQK